VGDLAQLRQEVLEANLALPAHGLVKLTWGNVSGVDRDRGLMAIKASGVDYAHMGTDDVVLVDLDTGDVAEGQRSRASAGSSTRTPPGPRPGRRRSGRSRCWAPPTPI
jgi:L-ribulose-5-phosphate 4-epimerase